MQTKPGFAFAAKSVSKIDFAAWICVILVCAGMTIQQTTELVKLYQTEPTAASITFKTGETLTLDQLVLSVPYSQYMDRWDDSSYWDFTEVKDTFEQINITEVTTLDFAKDTVFAWPIVKYLLRMFYQLAYTENDIIQNFNENSFTWNCDLYNFCADNEPQQEIFTYLLTQFQAANVSLLQLLKATLNRVCKSSFYEFYHLYTKDNWSGNLSDPRTIRSHFQTDLCKADNIVFFDQSVMAFKVGTPESPKKIAAMQDYLSFFLSVKDGLHSEEDAGNDQSVQLFFDGRYYAAEDKKSSENMLAAQLQRYTTATVRLRTSYSSPNLKRKPCLTTSTKFDCENLCFANIIRENCSCWPISRFSWKPTDLEMPFCGEGSSANVTEINHLKNCNGYQNTFYPILVACQNACLSQCDNLEFDFLKTTESTARPNQDTLLEIKAESFSYTVIEEALLKNWQTFLGEFGGLIGIWLGGSFIAFVHIPAFLVKTAYLRLKYRKRQSSTPPNDKLFDGGCVKINPSQDDTLYTNHII